MGERRLSLEVLCCEVLPLSLFLSLSILYYGPSTNECTAHAKMGKSRAYPFSRFPRPECFRKKFPNALPYKISPQFTSKPAGVRSFDTARSLKSKGTIATKKDCKRGQIFVSSAEKERRRFEAESRKCCSACKFLFCLLQKLSIEVEENGGLTLPLTEQSK